MNFGLDRRLRLFDDNAESRRHLCGKAWVAVTGSSSQEGPEDRNRKRAAMRAAAAQSAAHGWIENHPECGRTIVLGVDLGQHAPSVGESDDGAASAYQRQTLIVSRARADAGDAITASGAASELRAFLDDPASRAALYGGRVFPSEPIILPARE